MQRKFKIKHNNIKVSARKTTHEESSRNIYRKTFTDSMRINIITSNMVDTSNASRVLSPIQAQQKKQLLSGVSPKPKKRRAVRSLTLKSAPPIPTAPKDPIVRQKMWVVSGIKSLLGSIDIYFALTTLLLALLGIIAINSACLTFGSSRFVIVQTGACIIGIFIALLPTIVF